jgi:hypothetical protein
MRGAILAAFAALVMGWAGETPAQLENITNREAVSALKTALEKGSRAAVEQLGRENGFYGDARVKIPLPDSLRRTERTLRRFGMGSYADELVLTMNRAAEAAVPEAKQLFVDSVKKMTVQDAKGILTGGETAGTEYFKRTTSEQLRKRFLPIVKKSTEKVSSRRPTPVCAAGRRVRPGEGGAIQSRQLRDAEGARRPVFHGG